MDDLVIWAFDKWGYGAIIVGVMAYLVIEGGLDLVTDYISDRIRDRRRDAEIHPEDSNR